MVYSRYNVAKVSINDVIKFSLLHPTLTMADSKPLEPKTEIKLEKFLKDFTNFCVLDKNLSPGTVKLYEYYLSSFLMFLSENYKISEPKDITRDMIRSFRLFLTQKVHPSKGPLKRSTQNYFLVAIRAFLNYLANENIQSLPSAQVDLGKERDRSLKFLTDEQLDKLLSGADTTCDLGIRDRAIMETLFSTGLRVSELTALDKDQINLKTREFSVIGKGGKARVVFLTDAASFWIDKYLSIRKDRYKPLFVRTSGSQDLDDDGTNMRLSPRSVERLVDKYVKLSGLPVKVTPHTLRHSFATDLLMNGADLRSVQELLGHRNISTTQIYTHVTNKGLKEVHQAFHSRNKPEEPK